MSRGKYCSVFEKCVQAHCPDRAKTSHLLSVSHRKCGMKILDAYLLVHQRECKHKNNYIEDHFLLSPMALLDVSVPSSLQLMLMIIEKSGLVSVALFFHHIT